MLRKDKLVGAIVYYDGMFPFCDSYYIVLYLGEGEGRNTCSSATLTL